MALAPTIETLESRSVSVGNIDIDKIKDYSLHYLVKDKELQVGMVDNLEGRQLMFESYKLKDVSEQFSPDDLAEIIQEHHLLQAGFWKDVTVGFSNAYFSLVPKALYEPEFNLEYLKLTPADLDDKNLATSSYEQPGMDAVNVFAYDRRFNELLSETYAHTNIKYVHETSSFLESCLREAKENKTIFINIDPKSFLLCMAEGSRLLYLNRFEYKTREDFAYYVMAALKELDVDQEREVVTLWGEIMPDSPIYELLHKYIRFVEFGKRPNFLKFTFHFDEIMDHRYFTLFSQNLCK